MKRIIRAFLIVTFVVVSVFPFSACNGSGDAYEGKISEYRCDVYTGKNSDFSAEIITGYRENPFEIDGKTANVADYSLLTVETTCFDITKALSVTIEFEKEKFEGTALRHPYKESFSFEIPKKLTCSEITVTVSDGAKTFSQTLKSVKTGDEISGRKALLFAADELSESIKPYCDKNGFNGEVFVRYIKNPLSSEEKYFWYVAFIPKSDAEKIIAVLLDPVTGAAQATRK